MILEKIKNLDSIYSSKYGKGTIVNVTWRKTDQLLMCYFKSIKEHVWLTSDEVLKDTTYSLVPFTIKKEDLKENVVKDLKTISLEDF